MIETKVYNDAMSEKELNSLYGITENDLGVDPVIEDDDAFVSPLDDEEELE